MGLKRHIFRWHSTLAELITVFNMLYLPGWRQNVQQQPQEGASGSVMNSVTPQPAVTATPTRWRYNTLKPSTEKSWESREIRGGKKQQLSCYILERQFLTFKNNRTEDTHFKVSSSAPLGTSTRV